VSLRHADTLLGSCPRRLPASDTILIKLLRSCPCQAGEHRSSRGARPSATGRISTIGGWEFGWSRPRASGVMIKRQQEWRCAQRATSRVASPREQDDGVLQTATMGYQDTPHGSFALMALLPPSHKLHIDCGWALFGIRAAEFRANARCILDTSYEKRSQQVGLVNLKGSSVRRGPGSEVSRVWGGAREGRKVCPATCVR
jgi:hypothetical protein